MARSKVPILLSLLGLAALASVLAATLPMQAQPAAWRAGLAGAWPTLLGGFLGAVIVTLALRMLAISMKKRGRPQVARALRPVESIAAAVAIIFVLFAATGNGGSALVSLGLVGFGLTLALQRPLLAIAGWLSIHVGRLFREGDRIETAGIHGDVIEINVFTTKIWEIGSTSSPLSSGGIHTPNRPTGRIVTLSNAAFLEHAVANATRDLSHVFDEFSVTIAYEGDIALARRLLHECGQQALDMSVHERAAREYEQLTKGMAIESNFPREPVIIESLQESWIELRLRYLIDARSRGVTRTTLARAWLDATREHAAELPNVYPRVQPQNVGADGRPRT